MYLRVARFPETLQDFFGESFWKFTGNFPLQLIQDTPVCLFLTKYIYQLKFVPKMNNIWPHCRSIVTVIVTAHAQWFVALSSLVSFSVSNISLEVLFYVSSGVTVSRSNIRDRLPSIGTLNLSKPNQLVTNSGFDYPTHWFCSWRCLEVFFL